MTPEQETFFEYGGAWEQVVLTHKGIRSTVKALPGKTRQKLLRQARNETHQHELILNAWRKRAACRAWQVGMRDCGNCKYLDYSEWDVPCCVCAQTNMEQNIERWEPRKEGE